MIVRSINPDQNEIALERIRVTFDEIVGTLDIAFEALETGQRPHTNLPEDLANRGPIKDKAGDIIYGLVESGAEAIAVYQALGWIIFGRDGSILVPDGMDELDPVESYELMERYDYWYELVAEYVKSTDMPDKIPEPCGDEIDVDEGFGDADLDGNGIDSED